MALSTDEAYIEMNKIGEETDRKLMTEQYPSKSLPSLTCMQNAKTVLRKVCLNNFERSL